jgi:hypothetical protein
MGGEVNGYINSRKSSPIITAMKISWPIKAIVMETTPLIGFMPPGYLAPVLDAEPSASRDLGASDDAEKRMMQNIDDPHRQERRSAPTRSTTCRSGGDAHPIDHRGGEGHGHGEG